MEVNISRKDWSFLFICLGLGWLAEISFLHDQIGVSFPIFIAGFYLVIFLRFKLAFNHRRIGLLMMVAIWILSGNYLFYDLFFFHGLNVLVIPVLVFTHIVLITSPSTFKWGKPKFISLLVMKILEAIRYVRSFLRASFKVIFKNMRDETSQIIIRILIGLVIGIPILFVTTTLLMSADTMFQNLILQMPAFLFNENLIEWTFRILFVLIAGFIFFGVFQVLQKKALLKEKSHKPIRWNHITAMTILIMLNAVYLLFVIIQFTYFFNGQLIEGFTYAEYARRGFFELVFVLLINWTLLIGFLKWVTTEQKTSKTTLQILYSLLIVMSGVMLVSAYMRLSMYEAAYGFTLDRVLAHVFMVYLMVIFAYTLMRVWLEKIPLLHFYLIVGLIFYTGLNVVNVEKVIVDKNMERYEQTGKIDLYYLDTLSGAGTWGLIELYEKDPEIEDLENVLLAKKERVEHEPNRSWQSFNFTRHKTMEKLVELKLTEGKMRWKQ